MGLLPEKTTKSETTKYHRKSNGEGSIFQRADKRWCAKIQTGRNENGKPVIKCFYGKKRKDVVEKLDRFKKEHGLIADNISKITVDDFITDWFKSVKIAKLKPTSYDTLESTINQHIIPSIGCYKLAELTTEQIQEELINDMIEHQYSYSTLKKAHDAINACYKYAVKSHKVLYNPVLATELPASQKFEVKEIHWFNKDEINKFEEECIFKYANGKFRYVLGYGMIFIMNTGLRIGEALALKWEDIDFGQRIVSITKNVEMATDRNSGLNKRVPTNQDTLKTKRGYRFVPLNDKAINSLMQLKEFRYFGEDSYILCTESGSQNKYHNFLRTFKAIIKRADLEDCALHTLRHTFATQLFARGISVEEVAALIGDGTATAEKTYIHIIEKIKAAGAKLLDL